MRVISFWKMFKFYFKFKKKKKKKKKKKCEKAFCFSDNSIWSGSVKFSLLIREHLPSAVNVLTNSLKILHIPKRYFFQLNYIQRDQWVWERSCFSDSNSVLTRLPCCFSKGPLKLGFLDIYLATYLRVSNFGNTSAMSVISCWKTFKI